MMNLNYFGSVWTTRAALPSMKEAGGGGTVVFVASQGSLVGLYGMTAYCGSKFAIRGFAESLAMGEILISLLLLFFKHSHNKSAEIISKLFGNKIKQSPLKT